jgi:hypothetical protein
MQDEPGATVDFSYKMSLKERSGCWGWTIRGPAAEQLSLEQIRAFLEGSQGVGFQAPKRKEIYDFVNQTLRQIKAEELEREGRGLVRRYLAKMTGLSRAQTTRLVGMYRKGEEVKLKRYRRHRIAQRYTREDMQLRAAVDAVHETLSGPATQKLLQRVYYDFGEKTYQRWARLSVAQLYRLGQSRRYREQRVSYQPTRPAAVSIGERRRPDPQGRPGYLRVDRVHPGDQDGAKGVYHLNTVDAVTQGQILERCRRLAKPSCCPCWKRCGRHFYCGFRGFIRTMAASTSPTPWRSS